ncbi:hypothetical protein B0H14DRAFT_3715524 [Mycena olivaceomarginata]|nr:hypothetical protein B0H14DRAFT_3715524 [Mycena olivaceomarginata]
MAAPQESNYKLEIHKQPAPCAPPPKYHVAFADPDAEITLLSLPPPPGGHSAEPITVHEPDAVVEPLLRLMCGLTTSPWTSLDQLSAVLALAQNWDAPATGPLRVYALTSHFGFRPETQLASTHTLSLNLFDPAHADVLASIPSTAALPLLRLHRRRRDALRDMLDSPERFLAGNGQPFHCSACAITPLENRTWRALKHRILRELDVCAGGDALRDGMWGPAGWAPGRRAKACWAAVCVKPGCAAANYDRPATIKQIRACLEGLSARVEVDWLREEGDAN